MKHMSGTDSNTKLLALFFKMTRLKHGQYEHVPTSTWEALRQNLTGQLDTILNTGIRVHARNQKKNLQ